MANVFVEESTLTNIADMIRNKLNSQNNYKPSEMPAAIEGIVIPVLQEKSVTANGEVVPDDGYNGLSKVIVNVPTSSGSGSSGGGTSTPSIENGYTVNFYNSDKELIQSQSAKCGMFIDKPISYTCESWQNESGYVNSFPLTVGNDGAGSVIDLYAGGAVTCEEQLYKHFCISKEEYPYVILGYYSTPYGLAFGKSISPYYSSASGIYTGVKLNEVKYAGSVTFGSFEDAVSATNFLLTNDITLKDGTNMNFIQSSNTYTNAPLENYGWTAGYYDLSEILYKPIETS